MPGVGVWEKDHDQDRVARPIEGRLQTYLGLATAAVTVVIRVIEDHRAASGSYNARYMGDLR